MKKILILTLAMVMILGTLVGCGGTAESSEPENSGKETEAADSLLSKSYVEVIKSGTYKMHYKATVEAEGTEMEMEATLNTDGKSIATVAKMQGMTMRTLFKDDKVYSIDDANKIYRTIDMPKNGTGVIEGDGLDYVSSGKEEINGETLEYDEYAVEGEAIKFYFQGKDLKYMRSVLDDGEVLMEIIELSNDIDKDSLEIPSDYKGV